MNVIPDAPWGGNVYLHFPLNVATFCLMWANIPYMEHLGIYFRNTLRVMCLVEL